MEWPDDIVDGEWVVLEREHRLDSVAPLPIPGPNTPQVGLHPCAPPLHRPTLQGVVARCPPAPQRPRSSSGTHFLCEPCLAEPVAVPMRAAHKF
jgi:hypothetical protein